MLELLSILAWPLVALCALCVFAWAFNTWRHPTVAQLELDSLKDMFGGTLANYKHLAERVGQLEIAQGVKRGR